ncbi:MAG: fibronectin type III domain-containing protein, partial [Thermoplasmatota archaeon]
MRSSMNRVPYLFLALLMVASTFAAIAIVTAPDTEVEAAKSEKSDKSGYIWVDNKNPDPKVEFDWIDGTKGEYLDGAKYYYDYQGGETHDFYDLPFQFEFYGRYFDRVMVHASGYLDFAPYYDYYYSYNGIPYTGYSNGFIAVHWGYTGAYYYYGVGEFKVFALEGETFGDRWVCFQWDHAYSPGSYKDQSGDYFITYQCIIYESGLIKMQYLDVTSDYSYGGYTKGGYSVVGIEDHDGRDGLQYSAYADSNLDDGLAIMFGKNLMEVQSADVDTDEGGAMYAESRDYSITADVRHPIGNELVQVVGVTLGDGFASAVMFYNSDGSYYFSEVDPNGYLQVNTEGSSVQTVGDVLRITFLLTPTFEYPTNTFQDLKITAMGLGAMPGGMAFPDAFWVENKLTISGSLLAYSFDRGFVENGGWVHGNEHFQFRGVRAVYPGTAISPMPGAISFTVTDELGNPFVQSDVEEYCQVDVLAENDFVRKLYNLTITGVPPGTDISDGISYLLNVDPYKPLPPQDIAIHADSYDDRNILYDDDNEVYVTWEPAEDFESGILGYYVTTYDPSSAETRGEATWVQSPDTSVKIIFSGSGSRKVWVWSVDKAGNPSVPEFSVTKIDNSEISFSEFSPGHQIWVNTHTPICSVLINDGEGSGVSAKDIQYAISTSTINEYSAWQSAKIPRDSPEIRLSVSTNLVNGKTNWIKFRGKDVAGNGWTESQDYNVWVDEEPPIFTNFRPYETEYQNGRTVVVSLDLTDIHSNREGSGVRTETIEFRYTTAGKGLYGDWTPVEVTSLNPTYAHVEMEIEFEEGMDNYIQFRAYDNVGNYATSKEFNIKVNSAPMVKAFLSEPKDGMNYVSTEKILFDASGTVDIDGDDLTYSWYSDINRFLSSSPSFFRSLSPGVHSITLVVNDPAHSVVTHFEITVYEEDQIDPMSIDSDGDGIYDDWEIM